MSLHAEVVLFSVVAFKTLEISQGSVATHLRYDGIFSDSTTPSPLRAWSKIRITRIAERKMDQSLVFLCTCAHES